ncbi:hypothetical protein DFH09DRAFT_1203982 [Mycena vulgaris]|nr:hypothetical protein DFH09DRAFT_1203982 [Mycena vulgaris]
MRVPIFSTGIVVLSLSQGSSAFIIFCFLVQLLSWGGNRCGWRPPQQAVGPGPAAPVVPPPAPITCGTGTYLWGMQCLSTIGVCRNAPALQKFAHKSKPCGCQAPGAAFDADKTVCDPAPANGKIGCETANTGASSSCIIECDIGYQLVKGNCLPAAVKSCNTNERVATGPRFKGCICLPITTLDGIAGQACPAMTTSDGNGNHGRMICALEANGNPRCTPECAGGFEPYGNTQCAVIV